MYRTAARRLFISPLRITTRPRIFPRPAIINPARFCTSTAGRSFSGPNQNASSSSQTTSSSAEAAEEARRKTGNRRSVTEFKDEQAKVLQGSLRHVNRLGWTESAMMAGAREVGVSPSIVGSFSRKEAALVEYFMDECLERLIDIIETDVELKNLIPSERILKLVRLRLEMQAPYISKWAQALSIQVLPTNLTTSFKQRAGLVDEIWHAAGDESSDLDWYVKRSVLGGIYSTTEVYMLTDNSPDFRDTWAFLAARVRDAFDLKKTLQEVQYLTEAVSAGLGGSIKGMVKGGF